VERAWLVFVGVDVTDSLRCVVSWKRSGMRACLPQHTRAGIVEIEGRRNTIW
jgi:hypothetical protein